MNKYFNIIASAMVTFAVVLSAFASPIGTAFATTETVTSSASSYTTCSLEASRDVITVGEGITLNWQTSGFDSVKINGESVSGDSGSKTVSNLRENTTFTLTASNNEGSECSQQVHITCLPPEVPEACELVVDKEVNKISALPGEQITYTITVKNVGDADCTGGGVKIKDVVDPNLSYLSHQITSNLSAGYGSDPVYNNGNRTLSFNGHVLEPSESGTITWIGKINTPNKCGDFKIKNQAKATAKELNNFKNWAYSQTVKTAVDNDCDEPEKPVKPICPYTAADGVVVNFSGVTKLLSNKGESESRTAPVAANIPVGEYSVKLVAWDGYTNRVNISQPHEQYRAVVANSAGVIAETNDTTDLADNVVSAIFNGQVNSSLNITKTGTEVYALHSVYPDKTSPNSLVPICAVFKPKDVPTVPECPLTSADGRIILNFPGKNLLLSNKGINEAQTAVQSANIDPGTYDITLVSWDGYNARVNHSQPHEQWKLQFMNSSSVIGTSGVIGDLADNVREALKTEKVNTGFVLGSSATGFRGMHAFYPDTSSPNSLYPICVALDKKEVPTPPVCPLEPAEGRTIVNFAGLKLRSDKGINNAETAVQSLNVDPGKYDITLVSWDGYTNRVSSLVQPHEQWQLQFMNNSSVVASSGIIGDLEDNVVEATKIETVNTDFMLNSTATGLRAVHPFYPDTTSPNSLYPICAALDEEPIVPVPSCDLFTANPATIMVGASTTLTWETSNAEHVFLNNAIGEVDLDGSISVAPLADITYQLTVVGANDQEVNCEVPVKVSEDTVPACEVFTATPGQLPVGGGDVTLNWEVLNATDVTITPTVGSVGLVGSSSVNVTESTNFTLTAIDGDGDQVTCPAPVVVADPEVFSCENNVSFSASDTSIRRGQSTVLNWSTTNVDSVSINVINATTLSGSQSVTPSNDVTYTLTATKGSETVNCPVSVTVSGGGGGGSSPRCDLEISDSKIKLGEEITLTWDTSRATEVTLTDDRGKIIFTTDEFLAGDKEDYYDGSIKLKPTRDTKYTLLAERGSRDDECSVKVELEDSVVVLQSRDQQPLVAGISLSQVPYTGFEAGTFMTFMFYVLLVVWALYITYLLVIRKRTATPGSSMNGAASMITENQHSMKQAEATRPDAFVANVTAAPVAAPTNLPTGNAAIGYENNKVAEEVNSHQVDDEVVTQLENRAHQENALLSSDAIRHFVGTTEGGVERNQALDSVIAEAKKTYPLEDGWIVINESRMQNLCEVCKVNQSANKDVSFVPATVPEGTGSLAEAIVTGNVVAAYEMIGNRPMFALADAAADLDAVYRHRRGGAVEVSELLLTETKDLSDEKIKNMIDALTGALDGTYTDEASAVKVAIMKAVKEAA